MSGFLRTDDLDFLSLRPFLDDRRSVLQSVSADIGPKLPRREPGLEHLIQLGQGSSTDLGVAEIRPNEAQKHTSCEYQVDFWS